MARFSLPRLLSPIGQQPPVPGDPGRVVACLPALCSRSSSYLRAVLTFFLPLVMGDGQHSFSVTESKREENGLVRGVELGYQTWCIEFPPATSRSRPRGADPDTGSLTSGSGAQVRCGAPTRTPVPDRCGWCREPRA